MIRRQRKQQLALLREQAKKGIVDPGFHWLETGNDREEVPKILWEAINNGNTALLDHLLNDNTYRDKLNPFPEIRPNGAVLYPTMRTALIRTGYYYLESFSTEPPFTVSITFADTKGNKTIHKKSPYQPLSPWFYKTFRNRCARFFVLDREKNYSPDADGFLAMPPQLQIAPEALTANDMCEAMGIGIGPHIAAPEIWEGHALKLASLLNDMPAHARDYYNKLIDARTLAAEVRKEPPAVQITHPLHEWAARATTHSTAAIEGRAV